MPRKKVAEFPSPYELSIPGTEGWERMYPSGLIFPKERRKKFEKLNLSLQHMHWPRAMKPFDVDAVHFPASKGLSAYQHRIFVVPPSRGLYFYLVNGYHYGGEAAPPYTDPKLIDKRLKLFLQRMIYCWWNWKKIYGKWKRDMLKMFKEQDSLREQIHDLPELEDLEFFKEVRGITSARKLVEIYNRVLHLYMTMQEGYQYQFIGAAYATDLTFTDFCHKAFPGIEDRTIAKMLTGAELEAFRPDEEVKRLARLAVKLGLASDIKKATDFKKMRSEFEKTGDGRKWNQEFDKSSFPWFNMMVTQGIFAYSDEECWIENPNIILGFLKNYIEKIKKGEKIERDVKSLKKEKEQLFKEHLDKLKTKEEKARFKELYNLATTFYEFVEDQVVYIKSVNYALFRRNIRKFAEILAKHGVIKEPEDIFYLRFGEIKSALEDLACAWGTGDPPSLYWIKEIEWRKKIYEKFEKWDPPTFVGPWKKEVTEPFVVVHGGITTDIVNLYRKLPKPEEVKELKGIPASTGVAEGPARVIKASKDISKIRPGEILVCPHTTPAWTPAFAIIKGIVTNQGGAMSHAGIVSREYKIPAVLGTWLGTSAIKTGNRIRVDGDAGIVTLLK